MNNLSIAINKPSDAKLGKN